MKVKQIMSIKPDYIDPTLTVQQAADEMLKRDIGFLPIGDKNEDKLSGVLTDRDIVVRCIAKKLDPNKVQVKDIMSPQVMYCFENDTVETAAKSMEELQIHRLIVLNENKRLVGILSLGDIATKGRDTTLSGEIIEKICA